MTPAPPALDAAPGRPIEPNEAATIERDCAEIADLYFQQCTPVWERAARYWRLYLSDKDDPRGPDELWRANLFIPRPYSAIEASVAVLSDIFNSADPPIQAEGRGFEDNDEGSIERLLAYQLHADFSRKKVPQILRARGIQGTEFCQLTWVERTHTFTTVPRQRDQDDFHKAMMDVASQLGGVPPPDPQREPEGFDAWRQLVNATGKVKVPSPPSRVSERKQFVRYRGPSLQRVPLWDVLVDPTVDEMEDQQAIMRRMVKPTRWVEGMAGPEEWKPYDQAQVALALSKSGKGLGASGTAYNQRFQSRQQAVYDILGITTSSTKDPFYENPAEIFECYFPGGGVLGEYPFLVLLNGVVINKRPGDMPFAHGMVPLLAIRNVQIPGYLHGISDLQPPEHLFYELNTFRNLRLDGATLAVLPVFAKLMNMGVPELMRKISPGAIIPVPRMDGLQTLLKHTMPEAAYREPEDIMRDIDDATSIGGNVKGQTSTVGRVPATESTQRLQQALNRLKMAAVQFEEDLGPYIPQSLGLWYEFGDSDLRQKIAGSDPLAGIPRESLLEGMAEDYTFRGATNAINRGEIVTSLQNFGKEYGQFLTPPEMRELMASVIDAIGVRRKKAIVSDEGTKDANDAYDMKKQAVKQQAAMQQQQMLGQQVQPPAQVDPATMDAISQQAPPQPAGGNGAAPAASPEGAPQ